ncbi:MAG: DUF167 domain-containing protein [Candidatus Eiseniibacteriota bacterium]
MRFRIHVTPRRAEALSAKRGEGVVRISVSAPPEDGAANEAVLALLRRRLRLPAGALRIVGGATSRWKWIEAEGLSEEEWWRRLGPLE